MAKPLKVWNGSEWVEVAAQLVDTDQFLTTATASGTYVANSVVSGKGSLIAATADDTPADLPVGTDGQLLVADSSASTGLSWTNTVTANTTFETASGNPTSLFVRSDGATPTLRIHRAEESSSGSVLQFYKNRGTIAAPTAGSSGDDVALLQFRGHDGNAYETLANIRVEHDGTPSSGDIPGRIRFATTPSGSTTATEAMRINNGQELLIGYTSDNGAYKLQVNSQIFATSATVATSDGRYKENVASLEGMAALVQQLNPVEFTWKPQQPILGPDGEVIREAHNFPTGTQVGFIAQEVQQALEGQPFLGSIIKRNVRPEITDAEGNVLAPEEEFYGIAEGNMIAVLTAALQEALGRIDDLEATVAALS